MWCFPYHIYRCLDFWDVFSSIFLLPSWGLAAFSLPFSCISVHQSSHTPLFHRHVFCISRSIMSISSGFGNYHFEHVSLRWSLDPQKLKRIFPHQSLASLDWLGSRMFPVCQVLLLPSEGLRVIMWSSSRHVTADHVSASVRINARRHAAEYMSNCQRSSNKMSE